MPQEDYRKFIYPSGALDRIAKSGVAEPQAEWANAGRVLGAGLEKMYPDKRVGIGLPNRVLNLHQGEFLRRTFALLLQRLYLPSFDIDTRGVKIRELEAALSRDVHDLAMLIVGLNLGQNGELVGDGLEVIEAIKGNLGNLQKVPILALFHHSKIEKVLGDDLKPRVPELRSRAEGGVVDVLGQREPVGILHIGRYWTQTIQGAVSERLKALNLV